MVKYPSYDCITWLQNVLSFSTLYRKWDCENIQLSKGSWRIKAKSPPFSLNPTLPLLKPCPAAGTATCCKAKVILQFINQQFINQAWRRLLINCCNYNVIKLTSAQHFLPFTMFKYLSYPSGNTVVCEYIHKTWQNAFMVLTCSSLFRCQSCTSSSST